MDTALAQIRAARDRTQSERLVLSASRIVSPVFRADLDRDRGRNPRLLDRRRAGACVRVWGGVAVLISPAPVRYGLATPTDPLVGTAAALSSAS